MCAMTPALGAVEINASCMTQNARAVTAPLAKMMANGAAPKRRGDAREKVGGTRMTSSGWVKRTKKGGNTHGVKLSRLEQIARQERRKT